MTHKTFRITSATGILCCMLALLSCTGPVQSDSQEASNDTLIVNPDLEGMTIGMSAKTLNAPYFVAQLQAVKSEVEKRGMHFSYLDARDDIVNQMANVEDLLARGIDLLILNPLDPKALVTSAKHAARSGVPVIIIDSSIDPAAPFVTTIQSNNLENGEKVGEWLAGQMKGSSIRAAVLSGAQGNPVGKERRQGIFRGIIEQQLRSRGASGFEIVTQGWGNWTYEGGLKAMEDILVAHPDINVLISEQDAMALGARQAIMEAGREKDILIVSGADGQKEALALIASGAYGATGLNDPVLIAKMAVETACRVLSGEKDFPAQSYTPAVCISADNVDVYYDPEAAF